MDLRMPGMDGLEATRRIMQETPTPIVIVTASLARNDHHLVFEALRAGALAVVAKPELGSRKTEAAEELRRTVKSMAQVRVIRRWAPDRLKRSLVRLPQPAARPQIVAIGASTGGPQALQEILTQIPAGFPLPILVVQHIASGFEAPLVDWLTSQCALPVQLAESGQALGRPGIYVAPHGHHLVICKRSIALMDDPPVNGHRPSATVLFQSVARAYGPRAIGVLLTGMGEDGASGMQDLKEAGGVTIAQDEASSVIFGMPAKAIGLGVVDHVLPASRIAASILALSGLDGGDS
jgi:two-component system chemotaxis response regulator CheB